MLTATGTARVRSWLRKLSRDHGKCLDPHWCQKLSIADRLVARGLEAAWEKAFTELARRRRRAHRPPRRGSISTAHRIEARQVMRSLREPELDGYGPRRQLPG